MVHFKPCACGREHLARIHRTAWMRLVFPSRSLYHCAHCGGSFLLSRAVLLQLNAVPST